jgi:hypothetical protein
MPFDPLRRRPNPAIPETLRLLRKSFAELRKEDDYTRRIGRARVLIAHLESLIDEPELVPGPVVDGTGSGARFLLSASEFEPDAVPFRDEYPFERPGPGEGLCFFYACSRMSPLYAGPALDPYRFPRPLHQCGPWVYSLEKRVATELETARRIPAAAVDGIRTAKRRRRAVDPHNDELHFVLCDPRGFDDEDPPTSIQIGSYASLTRAVSAAERLSGALGIRMVVGTVKARFCTY